MGSKGYITGSEGYNREQGFIMQNKVYHAEWGLLHRMGLITWNRAYHTEWGLLFRTFFIVNTKGDVGSTTLWVTGFWMQNCYNYKQGINITSCSYEKQGKRCSTISLRRCIESAKKTWRCFQLRWPKFVPTGSFLLPSVLLVRGVAGLSRSVRGELGPSGSWMFLQGSWAVVLQVAHGGGMASVLFCWIAAAVSAPLASTYFEVYQCTLMIFQGCCMVSIVSCFVWDEWQGGNIYLSSLQLVSLMLDLMARDLKLVVGLSGQWHTLPPRGGQIWHSSWC